MAQKCLNLAVKNWNQCLWIIFATHVEDVKLGPADLFLAGASAWRLAVVFADPPVASTAVGPLVPIAHLFPRRGIGVDAGLGEEAIGWRKCQENDKLWPSCLHLNWSAAVDSSLDLPSAHQ